MDSIWPNWKFMRTRLTMTDPAHAILSAKLEIHPAAYMKHWDAHEIVPAAVETHPATLETRQIAMGAR